jgi:integrase
MNRATGKVYELNGKWAYRVQWREAGERRSKSASGFPTKGKANAALREVLGDIDKGLMVSPQGTVGDFLIEWLDTYTRSGAVKRSTSTACADHVHRHLIPRIGGVQLAKLSPSHIAKLYADLLTSGESRHLSGRGLSAKTVRNIAQTLKKALNDGVKFGKVTRNVAEGVDLPRYEKPELEAWTNEQLQQFLRHSALTNDYLLPIWYLLGTAPLRRGEVCGLRWNDIDFLEGVLTVRRTRLEVQGEIFEDTPKSKTSRRRVAIDSQAVIALAKFRNAQEQAAQAIGGWNSDYVLTDLDGQLIDPESLTRRFHAASKRAGVPHIRLHSLRHTWAAWALQEGVSVHVVAGRLGHSDAGFTLRTYAPFMPHQDRETADKLGGKLAQFLAGALDQHESEQVQF